MAIWNKPLDLGALNAMGEGTIHDALGIRYTAFDADSLSATMPVAATTRQPFGLLHGGASVVLAESLGSMAAYLCCAEGEVPVGIEVNANHLRSVREGLVTGTAHPVHVGKTLHVWGVEITDEGGQPICVARLTVIVRAERAPPT